MQAAVKNVALGIGTWVREFLTNLTEFLAIFYATVFAVLKLRFRGARVVGRVLMNQIRFTGVHALGPITIASLAIGSLVIIQAATFLPSDYIISVSTTILIKEIIPLLTALILIARSGTAIAIEISNMKLNEELAAILKMGIPVEHFVFAPRLLGMLISFVGLVIYADFAAIIGGFWLARAADVTPITFTITEFLAGVQIDHFFQQMLKVIVFGVVIALTSIQYALRVKWSVREVPIITTTAVVRSIIACLLITVFISVYL
jgi:phospholipid/cholesterol/gamma-HCH transport system permease protein